MTTSSGFDIWYRKRRRQCPAVQPIKRVAAKIMRYFRRLPDAGDHYQPLRPNLNSASACLRTFNIG